MRRNLGIIAGATVVAATIVATTQTGLLDRPQADITATVDDAEPAMAADRAPALPPVTATADPLPPDPALEAEIARLTGQLAEREAELAGLRSTLAERDAALDAARTEVAALGAELAALKSELAALRERYAFELQLAAVKAATAEEVEPVASRAEVPEPVVPGPVAVQVAIEAPMTAIHFEIGSARLTPGGQAHAAAAAVMLADMPFARIRVSGYADRTGNAALNQSLAEARARSVADFLIAAGLPAERIETSGRIDPEMLPVTTAANVSEPLNRAATITPVPPPTT